MAGWVLALNSLPAILGLISIALGGLVYYNTSDKIERHLQLGYALFATSRGVWQVGISIFLLTSRLNVATMAAMVYYVAGLIIVWSFCMFALEFTRTKFFISARKLILTTTFLPILIYIVGFVLRPETLMRSIDLANRHIALNLPAYIIYVAIFILYGLCSLVILWRYVLTVKRRRALSYMQIKAVTVAMTIALPAGFVLDVLLPLFGNYKLIMIGPLFTTLVVANIYYTIRKYQLFNIRYAAIRTLSYSCTLVALAIIYSAAAYVISHLILSGMRIELLGVNAVSIGLTLVLVTIFQPIKHLFDRITNSIFFHDTYTFEKFYAEFTQKISGVQSMPELLETTCRYLEQVLKAEMAQVVIAASDQSYSGTCRPGCIALPPQDVTDLINYVSSSEGSYEAFLVDEVIYNRSIKRMLVSHHIKLVLPLYRAGEIIGFVFLGERKSSRYTYHDIKLLQMVASEFVIAIQNALSVQEIRDFNDTLKQRIDEATSELRRSNAQLQRLDTAKNEFVSMASHQLRTPLTSVKGYIDMVIQGDAGEITDMQKHLLSEAFTSSDRMVHLINDFLNVSRLQTGKFMIDRRPVNLKKIVAEEVESLQISAQQRKLKISFKPTGRWHELNLDEGKIRQVVMNFIDNALYYSRPDTTIRVELKQVEERAVLTVHDSGIGVPKSEQSHLFTKFFRATNARRQRPDGTGVGLFLAKKVITSHGGKVIFESKEGQGSTFGFSLPLSGANLVKRTEKTSK